MRIDQIELFYVSIPLAKKKPGFFAEHPYFSPSWIPGFRQSEVRFYLLKLTTDEGHEGVAAMPAMGPERNGIGTLLGNYLLGINPMDIQLVNQRIQEFSYLGMRNTWVDAAFWDIIGKVKGEPLWKIFGGTGGHIKPYASTGSTHGHDPVKVREIIKRRQDEGFEGVKLRVKSNEVAPMVDYIGAAREAAGKDLQLMVDANQGWPVDILDETPKWDVEFATQFARAIEPFDISWLEEPLNRGNFEGLAALRRSTKVPIAGAEMNSSWRDFQAMLSLGSLDIYQPDAVLVGGTYAGGISVTTWLIKELLAQKSSPSDSQSTEQDAIAAKGKCRFCPHTWTTGLGFAIALQLVGILPPEERKLLEYPLEGHWEPAHWARFIRGGFPINADGAIQIPDTPGLGVEIDWSVIKKFGKRVYLGNQRTVGLGTLFDRGWKRTMYLKGKKEEQLARSAQATFSIPKPPF